tara:strand:- start:2776 stop:2961 length:186 start_codon:yes stop_codon:yes gene_type:complete
MKAGDIVKIKPECSVLDMHYGYGIVIEVRNYDESGPWYHIQWADEDMWHVAGDLELINENR